MSVSQRVRFEIFKRDKFTCQYCGRSAPDVILEVDHMQPVSKDGTDDPLNLVTSCYNCNHGKSNRLLSDDTAVKKQKAQLDALQERREQLDMLMQWQRSLIDLDDQTVTELASVWQEYTPGYYLNSDGLKTLSKWIKTFTVIEILEAIRITTSQYLEYEQEETIPTQPSVEKAFAFIPRIAKVRQLEAQRPWLKDLFYVRGILKNRFGKAGYGMLGDLEAARIVGISIEELRLLACQSRSLYQFKQELQQLMGDVE